MTTEVPATLEAFEKTIMCMSEAMKNGNMKAFIPAGEKALQILAQLNHIENGHPITTDTKPNINHAAAPLLYEALDNLITVTSNCHGYMSDPPTDKDAILFEAICQSLMALKTARGEAA